MESCKNKKILIVNSDFAPSGGAEWIAYKTYKILKENGINAYFFASNRQPFFEPDYEFKDYFLFIGAFWCQSSFRLAPASSTCAHQVLGVHFLV